MTTLLTLTAVGLLLTAAGSLLTPHSASAQRDSAQLPEEVTSWMARDQVRRWAAMIESGEALYADGTCKFCHGDDARGGPSAPDLTDSEWVQGDGSLEMIGEVIFWGVRRRDFADPNRRFQMNPKGGMELDYEEMEALTAYVWSLSNGTFLPQR
jgi:mono/diheme cytochrome c family protein